MPSPPVSVFPSPLLVVVLGTWAICKIDENLKYKLFKLFDYFDVVFSLMVAFRLEVTILGFVDTLVAQALAVSISDNVEPIEATAKSSSEGTIMNNILVI